MSAIIMICPEIMNNCSLLLLYSELSMSLIQDLILLFKSQICLFGIHDMLLDPFVTYNNHYSEQVSNICYHVLFLVGLLYVSQLI
jgi:hypothetical protein